MEINGVYYSQKRINEMIQEQEDNYKEYEKEIKEVYQENDITKEEYENIINMLTNNNINESKK